MSAARALSAFALTSAGLLLWGGLVESRRLVGRRQTISLPDWPAGLKGYRIGFFSDTHLSHPHHAALTRRGLLWLIEQEPDVVVFGGDLQNYHKPEADDWIVEALSPLTLSRIPGLAILGNHDYFGGEPDRLSDLLARCGFDLLRNRKTNLHGIQWVGVDSACVGRSDPYGPLLETDDSGPIITLWHEPDMVDHLPAGVDLMLSGHTHGGQFVLPGGWAPMTPRLGTHVLGGLSNASAVPLFVSRGIAVTGPPSRLNCPAEVNLLTLVGEERDL